MNKKGIVFFDVDGTLIDWKKEIPNPTAATKESIGKLKENGYLTFVATGRPKNIIRKNILDLGFDGIVGSNGAYIELDSKVLLNEFINNEDLKDLVNFFEENKIDYMLESQKENYINTFDNPVIQRFLEGEDFAKDNLKLEWNIEELEIPKIIALSGDEEDFKKTYEFFAKRGYSFMADLNHGMFEIYAEKYSKGYGVNRVLEKLNISRDKAYAFGDGQNDLEMFQEVKHGIAMGVHYEGLKEFAFDITETVENEGITKGLEKLGLI